MTKKCTKCQSVKLLDAFSKNSNNPDALDRHCKDCRHQYYVDNAPRKIARQMELLKSYTPEQQAKVKETKKKYRQTERYKQWRQKYRQTESYKQQKRDWDRKQMKDPLFRLGVNLRGNMYHALKAMKGFRRWRDLVGYGVEELAAHLESKFTEGISWDNYGSVWHIDHIIPKSWFKYTSTDDPKFKECWALSNLQPKIGTDNQRKGNRFAG